MAEEAPAGMTAEAGSFVNIIRGIRNKEQWERVDSYLIGPAQKDQDGAWFNNWEEFSRAQSLKFFSKVRNVNPAWSNTAEREDWAQLIYGMYLEWFCPGGALSRMSNPFDFDWAQWWTTEVPRSTSLEVKLADTDNVLIIPANHAPSGHGTTEQRIDGAAAPSLNPGQVGIASYRELFRWPIPLGVPAVKRISVILNFDERITEVLRGITNAPGFTSFSFPAPANPLEQTTVKNVANLFGIRCTLLGPRFAQLRGAYSQGQT